MIQANVDFSPSVRGEVGHVLPRFPSQERLYPVIIRPLSLRKAMANYTVAPLPSILSRSKSALHCRLQLYVIEFTQGYTEEGTN